MLSGSGKPGPVSRPVNGELLSLVGYKNILTVLEKSVLVLLLMAGLGRFTLPEVSRRLEIARAPIPIY